MSKVGSHLPYKSFPGFEFEWSPVSTSHTSRTGHRDRGAFGLVICYHNSGLEASEFTGMPFFTSWPSEFRKTTLTEEIKFGK